MGSIVDQQVIVAVELQHVEAEHEALQHRVRLEGDDAVQIPLILRPATRHPCWLSSLQMLQRQNYACMCVRVCGASASHVG